jgi:hypothetical protein
MKTRLLIFLLLAQFSALAQIQVTRKMKRPDGTGVVNFRIDSIGRGRFVGKAGTGSELTLKSDTSDVINLGKKLSVIDQTRAANYTLPKFRAAPSFGATPPISIFFSGSDGGVFYLDSTDTTTPDDTATVRVKGAYRFKRDIHVRTDISAWGYTYLPISSTVSQSSAVQTTNTKALTKAVNSGYSLWVPISRGQINGKVRVNNKPFDIEGYPGASQIEMTANDSMFVVDNTSGLYAPRSFGVTYAAAGSLSNAVMFSVLGYPVYTGTEWYVQKPSVFFTRNRIIGANHWRPGVAGTDGFKKGLVVTTPQSAIIDDNFIQSNSGYSADGTVGIDLSSVRAANVFKVHRNQITQIGTGIAVMPGPGDGRMEGGSMVGNAILSCYVAIDINSPYYKAPGWVIRENDIAVARTAFKLTNINQVVISDNTPVYIYGNTNVGDYSAFLEASNVNDVHVSNNKFIYQEIGKINDPYGIIVSGSSTDLSVAWDIHDNYIVTKSGGGKVGIWLQNYVQQNKVHDNQVLNAAIAVRQDLKLNYIDRNLPADDEDTYQEFTMTDVSGTKQLDLSFARSSYVSIPASQTGTLGRIVMPYGKRITVEFQGTMPITHDLNYIRLAGGASITTTAYQKLTFWKTPARVEEIGTPVGQTAAQVTSSIATSIASATAALGLGTMATQNLSGVASFTTTGITGGTGTFTDLTTPTGATANSNARFGSFEFQPYALNNAFFMENAYLGLGSFRHRNTGTANVIQIEAGELKFRSSSSQAANTAATQLGSYAQMKLTPAGDFAVGYQLSASTGVWTGAKLWVRGSTGNVLINTSSDDGVTPLQVNGAAKATQYKLTALNTAPASATDTGTLGEIRVTAGFIYICTATNTWVRTALATW